MKLKISMLLFVLVVLLSACQSEPAPVQEKETFDGLTIENLVSFMENEGLPLKEVEADRHHIFEGKLRGTKPYVYDLQTDRISVYVFRDENGVLEAVELFEEKTATMDLISFDMHKVQNVLIFHYPYETPEFKFQDKMKSIVQQVQ